MCTSPSIERKKCSLWSTFLSKILPVNIFHPCVSYVFHHWNKISRSIERGKVCLNSISEILVHGCLAPWTWAEHHIGSREMFFTLSCRSRKQDRKEAGIAYPAHSVHSDLWPPLRLHLLKFPGSPKMPSSVVDKVLSEPVGDTSYSNCSSPWKVSLSLSCSLPSHYLRFSFLNFHSLERVFLHGLFPCLRQIFIFLRCEVGLDFSPIKAQNYKWVNGNINDI